MDTQEGRRDIKPSAGQSEDLNAALRNFRRLLEISSSLDELFDHSIWQGSTDSPGLEAIGALHAQADWRLEELQDELGLRQLLTRHLQGPELARELEAEQRAIMRAQQECEARALELRARAHQALGHHHQALVASDRARMIRAALTQEEGEQAQTPGELQQVAGQMHGQAAAAGPWQQNALQVIEALSQLAGEQRRLVAAGRPFGLFNPTTQGDWNGDMRPLEARMLIQSWTEERLEQARHQAQAVPGGAGLEAIYRMLEQP